jgi:hypothetical protein
MEEPEVGVECVYDPECITKVQRYVDLVIVDAREST